MHFQRGRDPVLYQLLHEERNIGTLTRSPEGGVVFALHGFHTSTAAASAAWLAHSGRLAYEAQSAEAQSAEARSAGTPGAVHELTAHDADGAIRLCAGGREIARLSVEPAEDGRAPLWSIALPIGPADASAVFTLAAARRMWEAVRRAGLWRRMAQWIAPPPLTPAA